VLRILILAAVLGAAPAAAQTVIDGSAACILKKQMDAIRILMKPLAAAMATAQIHKLYSMNSVSVIDCGQVSAG
jgi:hypothetical protein